MSKVVANSTGDRELKVSTGQWKRMKTELAFLKLRMSMTTSTLRKDDVAESRCLWGWRLMKDIEPAILIGGMFRGC